MSLKRNHTVGLILAIVGILVVASLASIMMSKEGARNHSLEVGDFLKYQETKNDTTTQIIAKNNYTFEILGINGTQIYYKQSISFYIEPFQVDYYNRSLNGSPFAFDMNNFQGGKAAYVGNETLNTRWGELDTMHYANATIRSDIWMFNGFMVKYQIIGPTLILTELLADTNIELISG